MKLSSLAFGMIECTHQPDASCVDIMSLANIRSWIQAFESEASNELVK